MNSRACRRRWRPTVSTGWPPGSTQVAARAAPSHRFLRYGWFAAALRAYGGAARTLTVAREGEPAVALPIVGAGPAWLGW
jgi:cytolysin (calcineurin-like family phosphatase)